MIVRYCIDLLLKCTGSVGDGGSQPVFGGAVSSVGFAQLAAKDVGSMPAVFGSISFVDSQKSSVSSALHSAVDTSSVFGGGTKVIGFGDLASSGSSVSDFSTKSG